MLGEDVLAAYLYGSAVAGGLGPNSDLDLLVVIREPTTAQLRTELVARLRPISHRGQRPKHWRPVELTAVVQRDVKPLRIPPTTDFQYGEWLRDDLEAGMVDPPNPLNPDLLILLAQVRTSGKALIGEPAAEVIEPIPAPDLEQAMRASVDDLLADLDSDTTNVLLTLARIWYTLDTGEFTTKDAAADWAAARIAHGSDLRRAGAIHRGDTADEWPAGEAATAALELTESIRG